MIIEGADVGVGLTREKQALLTWRDPLTVKGSAGSSLVNRLENVRSIGPVNRWLSRSTTLGEEGVSYAWVPVRKSLKATPLSTLGSRGKPKTRSPIMFFWISSVPPAILAMKLDRIE